MRDRVLRRSRDRVISGVCAGIAEHYGWSPSVVRLAFIIVGLLGGASGIAYLVLLAVMPPPLYR